MKRSAAPAPAPTALSTLAAVHAKRLCRAIEDNDLHDAVYEWDQVGAALNPLVLKTIRSGVVPVATAAAPAPAPPPPKSPAPSVATYNSGASKFSSATKRSFIRRELSDRFDCNEAYCNACRGPHPFEHWRKTRNSVSMFCPDAGMTEINLLQAKMYLELAKHWVIRKNRISFETIGNIVYDAMQRGVKNPIAAKLNDEDPWDINNVRLVERAGERRRVPKLAASSGGPAVAPLAVLSGT